MKRSKALLPNFRPEVGDAYIAQRLGQAHVPHWPCWVQIGHRKAARQPPDLPLQLIARLGRLRDTNPRIEALQILAGVHIDVNAVGDMLQDVHG